MKITYFTAGTAGVGHLSAGSSVPSCRSARQGLAGYEPVAVEPL